MIVEVAIKWSGLRVDVCRFVDLAIRQHCTLYDLDISGPVYVYLCMWRT